MITVGAPGPMRTVDAPGVAIGTGAPKVTQLTIISVTRAARDIVGSPPLPVTRRPVFPVWACGSRTDLHLRSRELQVVGRLEHHVLGALDRDALVVERDLVAVLIFQDDALGIFGQRDLVARGRFQAEDLF